MSINRDLKPEQEPVLIIELDQAEYGAKLEEFNPIIGMGAKVLEFIDEAADLRPVEISEIPDNLVDLSAYRSIKQTKEPPVQSEIAEPTEQPKPSLNTEQLDLFNSIYKEHEPNIKKFVRSIAGSDAIAEEITQEAFIKIWRNLDRFKDQEGGSLRAWVYTVARNTSFNYTRQARAHPTSPSDKLDYATEETPGLVRVVASGGSAEDAADTAENREEVFEKLEILDEIAPQYKEALILAANDFTYAEIAEIMDRTASAVKSVLVRARQSLVKAYEKRQEIDLSIFDVDEADTDEENQAEPL